MRTATCAGAATIAATAFLTTSAEADWVRVSQEVDPGAQKFAPIGFVEIIGPQKMQEDQSGTQEGQLMSAADVYAYDRDCDRAYGGNAFLPEPNAAVMAVVDTLDDTLDEVRTTLFTVYGYPSVPKPMEECSGPASKGGSADMAFTLRFDDDLACLVRDDDIVDECKVTANGVVTKNLWVDNYADGFVLGYLNGRWQLDASFDGVSGVQQLIVRSRRGGDDLAGLRTDRAIRFDNAIEAAVDVQPGSDLGCLNIDGNGVIPVAILGSNTVDVAEIDVDTLEVAGMQVRLRGNGNQQCALSDVNGDAYLDLSCKFYDDPEAWRAGADIAELSGELLDSTPVFGRDSICIRPPA